MAVQLTPAQAGQRPGAQTVPTPLLRHAALEVEVRRRLGGLVEGAEPLLEETRRLVTALHPEVDAVADPPAPAEAAKMRERLAAAFDELEDLLEALLLARDNIGGGGGRG